MMNERSTTTEIARRLRRLTKNPDLPIEYSEIAREVLRGCLNDLQEIEFNYLAAVTGQQLSLDVRVALARLNGVIVGFQQLVAALERNPSSMDIEPTAEITELTLELIEVGHLLSADGLVESKDGPSKIVHLPTGAERVQRTARMNREKSTTKGGGSDSVVAITKPLAKLKQERLKKQHDDLSEEYEAVSQQLSETINERDQVRLKRQLASIERDILEIESQVATRTSEEIRHRASLMGHKSHQKPYGSGHKWAVIVGVNAYEDSVHYRNLNCCESDVQAFSATLETVGFDTSRIRVLTDSSEQKPIRNNIYAALRSVADVTESDDLLLFYYGGHGDTDGGESYLIGADGRLQVLSDTAVSVSRIADIINSAKARAKVIILDACHSGATLGTRGTKPMSPEFIERVFAQAEGMAILSSCTQSQFSYDWDEKQCGVFTHYLLEALTGEADWDMKGFVTVQDASRYVTDRVRMWASQQNLSQSPTLEYRVSGDIVLSNYGKVAL